nr:beta family protein [Methyloceanibacter caenitepidi]
MRSKAGEAAALKHLASSSKARTFPICVVMESPPASFASTVGPAWAGLPLALDGRLTTTLTGSATNFSDMFKALGKAGVEVSPSVSVRADTTYLKAVNTALGKYSDSLTLKAKLNDLGVIAAWCSNQGWNTKDIDLVITLGDIAGYESEMFHPFVANAIQTNLGKTPEWRTVTLVASSAPKNYSGLPSGRTNVPRREWTLWQAVAPALPFELNFGDTGQVHPSMEEPPGFAMAKATVSVRYTVDECWIILKGRPTSGRNGKPMADQYRQHAQTLSRDPQFDALPNCWADDRIKEIASGKTRSGNRTTWVSIGMNRHISLVTDRLP